jgi:uncharacterized protein (TIGR02118 family)
MSAIKLMVLYPVPTNVQKFENDYVEHLALFHSKMGLPTDNVPYTVTKFLSDPANPAPYYQMFTMPFASQEALQAAVSSSQMVEVAADAGRISSGGAPGMLVGSEATPLVFKLPD